MFLVGDKAQQKQSFVHQPGNAQTDSTNGSHLHNAVDFKASAKRSNHGYVNLPMTFNGAYKDFVQVNLCQKIFASTNPQYDYRLFIELRVQYKKTTSSVHKFDCFFLF